MGQVRNETREGYDAVADAYAAQLFDELKGKPRDRETLDRFAAALAGAGPVCDLGCGPGQIARYLSDRGVAAFGVDLSPGMVAAARRLNPDLEFRAGDMLALDAPDGAWAGIAAFYSIIHVPRERHAELFAELARVLRPAGLLLLAFHVGDETVHLDEFFGRPVSLDFRFLLREPITRALEAAGFAIVESFEREPYEGAEHPSRRAYVLARRS